jgi:hypothetical protein
MFTLSSSFPRPPVTFDFNFEKNCKVKTKHVPAEVVDWNDEIPRVAVSQDGVRIAAYLPTAVRKNAKVSYALGHCQELSEPFRLRIKSTGISLTLPNMSHRLSTRQG